VVPVKRNGQKTRLSPWLGQSERSELTRLLLEDLLRTVDRSGVSSGTFVVSPSAEILSLARGLGARGLREKRETGVNGAVELALSSLRGYEGYLVLPADLPLLRPSDLRRAAGLWKAGADVVISPSAAFNGTNLLILTASRRIGLSYDKNSFWNHLANAGRDRRSVAVLASERVMLDVDTESDAKLAAGSGTPGKSIAYLKRMVGGR